MGDGAILLVFITLQRFAEFIWDRMNTARLRAAGAVEYGRAHYPLVIATHAGWLAGLWILGSARPVDVIFLAIFLVLQIGRYWVLFALGPHWTTRIIVLPGAPLVRRGPYRYLRHPNYLIVAGEFVVAPLALGLPLYALLSLLVYAGVIAVRIRAENAALPEGT